MGSERVGSACVTKEGLYYRISCRCLLSGSVPCVVKVTGDREMDLGLCVPLCGGFGVETRIPIKRVGEGTLNFRVLPKHRIRTEQFVPVSAEEPFRYITRLKDAYLVRRNGQMGLLFTDRSPSPLDSDQNP